MTYNTGNPIGSTDARDRLDNSENLDVAVNSLALTFKDRLGVTRDTLEGIYQKSAYYRVGTFDAGYTLTNNRQTLAYGNVEYSWSGAFPKVVAAGSTPATSGGIGSGGWIDRTDVMLRNELASDGGAGLIGIGGGRTQANKNEEWVSITDFAGVVGNSNAAGTVGTDCTVALNAALRSGPKDFFIPIGFFRITDTILVPSDVRLHGAHMWLSCIVVDPAMDGAKDALQNEGYNAVAVAYDKNIQLENFRIKANGFSRIKANPTVEWGRCLRTGSLKGLTIDKMVFQEGPQHCLDLACWKDNYIGVGHAGVVQGMTHDARVTNSYFIDYCFDDGITTHGARGVTIENCTSIITDYAKSQHTYVITQNGFEIDDGSSDVSVTDCRAYCNDTESKGFSTANHPGNPIPYNVHFMRCDTYEGVSGCTVFGVADSTHVFGSEQFRGRNYSFTKCSLNYPHVSLTNGTFPSRSVDIQFGMNVKITDFRVNMRGPNGEPARSPCAIMNLIGCDIVVDGFRAEGVADGNLGSAWQTGQSWFRIPDAAARNVVIKNVDIDNIGWADRVIRDIDKNPDGALTEVDNVRVGSASTDGRTKTVIMSSAQAKFSNIFAPAGMQVYRIGRTLTDRTALMTGDVELDYLNMKTLIGGMRIFSETAADGTQPQPGFLFDRQFLSADNSKGKGSLAFRTSAAAQGGLGVAAFDEDAGLYVPIHVTTYAAAGSPSKALAPIVHGDTNLGQFSSAWLNGYFVNAPQVVSDARLKSEVRELTEAEIAAGLEIAKSIGFWRWTDGRGDREHSGTTVQKAISIMESHGLIPFDYAFICYAQWEDEYQTVFQYDEDGKEIPDSATDVLIRSAGNIYGFKLEELNLFLIRCLVSKLTT